MRAAPATPPGPSDRPGRRVAWWRDRRVLSWSLYDFANTPFAVLVLTVAFPPYFKEVVLEGARSGDFLWGLAGSLSMAAVVLTAPLTGAWADAARAKSRFLLGYTLFTILMTALLATVGRGAVVWGMTVFVLANIGYQGSMVFYNALLLDVSSSSNRGRVSGLGIGLGYVAAFFGLLLAVPFFSGDEAAPQSLGGLFVLVAAFQLVWSLPVFWVLRDRRASGTERTSPASGGYGRRRPGSGAPGAGRFRAVIAHLRAHPAVLRFLLSYLVYMEAIATMTAFTAIYARGTLGLSMSRILLLFMLAQLTAVPGSYLVGRLGDRFGSKRAVAWSLVLWLLVISLALFARSFVLIALVGLLAGVGTGGLQAVSRSLMAELSPKGREGEFFGFYAVAGRFSAVLGPVTFGAVSSLTGNQRFAVVFLGALLILALVLLRRVPEPAAHDTPGAPEPEPTPAWTREAAADQGGCP
jgi:MFS transporter, UMF1 family